MTAPVEIDRSKHTPDALESMSRECKDDRFARRLRGIAMILRGASRGDVARAQGVDTQTVRDWVIRFNDSGADGLRDLRYAGGTRRLNEEQRAELAEILKAGPSVEQDGVCRWRLRDLRDWILNRFDVSYTIEGVRGLIHRSGFRNLTPRPIHPKANPVAQEEFRSEFGILAMKAVPVGVAPEKLEIWFQDESRAGQKGMLSRVWPPVGTRPRIVRDFRYGYCYLFSAACPLLGTTVGHVCDKANTGEMNRHLAEISDQVQPGGHAVIILDGAGWHRSNDLVIPANLSLVRLPPYSPELNSMENVFNYLKSNFLANTLFPTVEDARKAVLGAWTRFAKQPALVASIMSRDWAIIPAASN